MSVAKYDNLARQGPIWLRNIEIALRRCSYLNKTDRALFELVYWSGQPTAMIAAASGKSRRSVDRQLAQILRRLTNARANWLFGNRHVIGEKMFGFAVKLWIEKISLRSMAQETGLTFHEVRTLDDTLHHYYEYSVLLKKCTKNIGNNHGNRAG